MALIDTIAGWLRSVRIQAALWLACTLVLFLYLRPWSITRDLEFRVKLENVGALWVMDWGPARGTVRNGHWIDLAHAKQLPAGSVIPDPQIPVLRVRLANYAVDDAALRWVKGPPGAKVTITDALVDDNILGVQVRRTRLTPLRIDNATTVSPPADGVLTMPVAVEPNPGDGGIYFACEGPPLWYQVPILAAAAAASAVAWALIHLLVIISRWWPRALELRAPRATSVRPTKRWPWRIAAMLATLAVPLWLHTWGPMLISGDSTAYILHAYLVHENGNFAHYDGWRLPGYALLILPFFAWMHNYAEGVAWAQMFMGMLSPLLAWGILRNRVPHPWPYVGAILVALDPGLFIWQRTLLTEAQCTLLIMLSSFLFLGCADRIRSQRPHAWLWAIGLALSLAAACYTRPNLQVLGVLAPLALAAITLLFIGWRRLAPALLCGVLFAGCMAPIVVFCARTFDTPAVTVGSHWNREVWSWENGVMDWNQSGFFSEAQYKDIRTRTEARRFSWWDLPQFSHKWNAPPAPQDLHEWAQIDHRCELLWKESAARRADAYLQLTPRAIGSMFGFPAATPLYFHGDPYFLSGSLMGDDSHSSRYGDTNYLIDIAAFPKKAQSIFKRAETPIGDIAHSTRASVVRAWYKMWALIRPAISLLLVFAIVRLILVRELGIAALGVILIAHNVAVPLLVFTGSDRYAMPWYGLMTLVALAGLVWRPARQ